MSISWNAERAAGRVQPERHNLRLKLKNNKKKATSLKLQATSALKKTQLKCINNLERRNYENIKARMARQS